MERGFWSSLPQPFVGLSPMDGVTDAPFRQIVVKYGQPDLIYTEFVNVEGLSRGAISMLQHFRYSEAERPIVAQLYGTDPASFRTAAAMVAALGFDGLDINMGCPAKKVAHRGAGAGLIRTPELAAEIIAACRAGIADWANGLSLDALPTTAKMQKALAEERAQHPNLERRLIPVSVKTRIGYDTPITEEWAAFLASQPVAAIAIHGRTLKQGYTGQADWSALARGFAAARAVNPAVVLIGNGDVASRSAAQTRAAEVGCNGVLLGRSTQGNPWVFQDHEPTIEERIRLAIEHARLFEQLQPAGAFPAYRRHLAAYIKGLPGAAALRNQLMQASDATTVEVILKPLL